MAGSSTADVIALVNALIERNIQLVFGWGCWIGVTKKR
jgi:hypothetical protein